MTYNPPVPGRRALRAALILAIVVYLTAAGWFSPLLDSPALRGALSGFGLVHFAVALSWLEAAMRRP
jgi:hypothetical protein